MAFAADVSKFVEKTKISADKVLRKIALDGLRGVLLGSPVDTGRFRGSWRVGINRVIKSVKAPPEKKKLAPKQSVDPATLADGSEKIGKAKFGDTIYITNNVVYAQRLEDGHSKQAPAGVLKLTAIRVFGAFEKAVKAVSGL